MWNLVRQHPTAVFVALLAHLMLLAFFIINVDRNQLEVGEGGIEPIRAEAILNSDLMQASPPKPDPAEEQRLAELERERLEQARQAAELELEQREQERLRQQAEAARQQEKLKAQQEIAQREEALARQQAEAEKREKEALRKQAEAEQRKIAEAARQSELKKQQEAEARKQAELKKQQEAEAERKAEAARKRKEEADRQAQLAAQKAAEREAEAQRIASAQAAEEQMLAQRRLQGERNDYILAIKQRVQSKWLRPPGSSNSFSCVVKVRQTPGGVVLKVDVQPSPSCDPDMQQSVEKAVLKADPLPKAPSQAVFVREINFIFEP